MAAPDQWLRMSTRDWSGGCGRAVADRGPMQLLGADAQDYRDGMTAPLVTALGAAAAPRAPTAHSRPKRGGITRTINESMHRWMLPRSVLGVPAA